jgi:hypothetical protein
VLYLAQGCFHSPVYLGSSLSSLRRRVCTSGGISGALSDLSSASASLSPSFLSLPFSPAPSGVCAFSLGRGVPARLGCSSSSPMTNSGSNSEGSGPFPVGAALLLSPSLDLAVRFDGDRLRELERLGVELERAGGVCGVVRCFACSSAIRASMAPRMRWGVHVSWVREVVHVEITWSP